MALYNKDSHLCDVIFQDPSIIPLLDRFGIRIGVGDDTIEEKCREHSVPLHFFLAVINTYLNTDYLPEKPASAFKAETLIEFLEKTDLYFEHYLLPNIERHFRLLIERSGKDNNLKHIFDFFLQLKIDNLRCIVNDREDWFPMILKKNCNATNYSCRKEVSAHLPEIPQKLEGAFSSRSAIEERVDDLASLLVMHLRGDIDFNLATAVVNAVFMLRKEIAQNNRIRFRILQPLVTSLFS